MGSDELLDYCGSLDLGLIGPKGSLDGGDKSCFIVDNRCLDKVINWEIREFLLQENKGNI